MSMVDRRGHQGRPEEYKTGETARQGRVIPGPRPHDAPTAEHTADSLGPTWTDPPRNATETHTDAQTCVDAQAGTATGLAGSVVTGIAGRAVLSDDPALDLGHLTWLPGGLILATARTAAATAAVGQVGDALPVILFEPRTPWPRRATPTSPARDRSVEAMIRAGFSRFAHGVALAKPVPGWTLSITIEGEAVLARSRELVCAACIAASGEWLAAATDQRRVLVLYGPRLGVLPLFDAPPGSEAARRAQLRESRFAGTVAAGLIAWRPTLANSRRTRG